MSEFVPHSSHHHNEAEGVEELSSARFSPGQRSKLDVLQHSEAPEVIELRRASPGLLTDAINTIFFPFLDSERWTVEQAEQCIRTLQRERGIESMWAGITPELEQLEVSWDTLVSVSPRGGKVSRQVRFMLRNTPVGHPEIVLGVDTLGGIDSEPWLRLSWRSDSEFDLILPELVQQRWAHACFLMHQSGDWRDDASCIHQDDQKPKFLRVGDRTYLWTVTRPPPQQSQNTLRHLSLHPDIIGLCIRDHDSGLMHEPRPLVLRAHDLHQYLQERYNLDIAPVAGQLLRHKVKDFAASPATVAKRTPHEFQVIEVDGYLLVAGPETTGADLLEDLKRLQIFERRVRTSPMFRNLSPVRLELVESTATQAVETILAACPSIDPSLARALHHYVSVGEPCPPTWLLDRLHEAGAEGVSLTIRVGASVILSNDSNSTAPSDGEFGVYSQPEWRSVSLTVEAPRFREECLLTQVDDTASEPAIVLMEVTRRDSGTGKHLPMSVRELAARMESLSMQIPAGTVENLGLDDFSLRRKFRIAPNVSVWTE